MEILIIAYSIPIIMLLSGYIGLIAAKKIYLNKKIIKNNNKIIIDEPILAKDNEILNVQQGYTQAIENYKLDCLQEDNI